METLKVAFIDFWPEIDQENIFLPILQKHFDVQVTRINPDVIIHSIFGRMQETHKYKCKKILYLGENWRPNDFGSNYSISFDPHTDTNYRLPIWQYFLLLNSNLRNRLLNQKRLNYNEEEFERWCAYIVSNPSNFIRNSAYGILSQYKHVNSYGRHLNNDMGLQKASQGRYWRDAKDEFFLKHSHKFMFAYENTPYKYYCTEKLMDAFLVGAMPIYWGDPKVSEDWNKEAFIDVTRGSVDIVKQIDSDKKRFRDMYEQPVFTEEQRKRHEDNVDNFEHWLIEKIKK